MQTFLSRLDPRLRFVRDYTTIRPHAAHCREQIVRVDVEGAMREAIAEARVAKAEGNKGYGAVVLMGDDILAKAHDTGITSGDPSLHAEHTAILEAIRRQGAPDLTGALLISTCEPCPMCTGLAVWSGVTTIMYGSSIADTAAMGRSRIQVSVKEIADRSPRVLDVVGGVLRAGVRRALRLLSPRLLSPQPGPRPGQKDRSDHGQEHHPGHHEIRDGERRERVGQTPAHEGAHRLPQALERREEAEGHRSEVRHRRYRRRPSP